MTEGLEGVFGAVNMNIINIIILRITPKPNWKLKHKIVNGEIGLHAE